MNTPIAITSIQTVSALGAEDNEIWSNYLSEKVFFTKMNFGTNTYFVAQLPTALSAEIDKLRVNHSHYKNLDATVLMALFTARKAFEKANWQTTKGDFGINIGSSRGATDLFEKYHAQYIAQNALSPLTSPTTTLGNIASWVAHDLGCLGPEISHSITCSTSLHALINGIAWLRSGMASKFMIGGSEAPLTGFTLAQMKALKIYSTLNETYPNRATDLEKSQNTMVLGEAAGMCCLELGETPNALAYIEGIGYATEILEHNISISTDAKCFQKSMQMALKDINPNEIDAIVMHAPGTIKGDLSEYKAIQKVFGDNLPLLTSNKWQLGHTFGASGILGVQMAVMMLQNNHFVGTPFLQQTQTKDIKKILINAVGFGGNAVSILISRSLLS